MRENTDQSNSDYGHFLSSECFLVSLVLHNMLLEKSKECYTPPGYPDEDRPDGELIEEMWRDEQWNSLLADL